MKTLLLGAVTAALLHITPTVVLVKRQDAVNRLLPGADQWSRPTGWSRSTSGSVRTRSPVR